MFLLIFNYFWPKQFGHKCTWLAFLLRIELLSSSVGWWALRIKTLQGQTEPKQNLEIMSETLECRRVCCLLFLHIVWEKVHFCWTKTTVHHKMLIFQRLWVDCAVCITHYTLHGGSTLHIAHCTVNIARRFNSTTASSASPLSPSVGAKHSVTCASTAYLHFSSYTHLYHSKHAVRWNIKLIS